MLAFPESFVAFHLLRAACWLLNRKASALNIHDAALRRFLTPHQNGPPITPRGGAACAACTVCGAGLPPPPDTPSKQVPFVEKMAGRDREPV